MRENSDVVFSAIYFSPVLEHYKYMKYLNREKKYFLAYNNKIIVPSHRCQDAS